MTFRNLSPADFKRFYDSQRDNIESPNTTCFPTSMCMGLRLLGVPFGHKPYHSGLDFPSYLARICRDELKASWLYHDVELMAAAEYLKDECPDIANEFILKRFGNGYPETVIRMTKECLDRGGLVVFPTNLAALLGGGGHMVLVVGYDEDTWLCLDPYGDADTTYSDIDGNCVSGGHYRIDSPLMQMYYGVSLERS